MVFGLNEAICQMACYFFIFKNQKEGPQKRNIWERRKPICYAFKARNIRLPKTEHCVISLCRRK